MAASMARDRAAIQRAPTSRTLTLSASLHALSCHRLHQRLVPFLSVLMKRADEQPSCFGTGALRTRAGQLSLRALRLQHVDALARCKEE